MFKLISTVVVFLVCSCGPLIKKEEAVFMPKNTLLSGFEGQTLVTEEDFFRVIDLAEEIYEPIFANLGGILTMNPLWEDPTVNASASQQDGYWFVNMYGGLARRPEVTVDGFIVVLCHEIGHHLAGFPFTSSWAANEGQSDYYATQVCLRKIFAATDNRVAEVPGLPRALCDAEYTSDYDRNICNRSILAGKSTSDLIGALNNEVVFYTTQDQGTVRQTNNNHPAAQCRLDTMMAGALCDILWDDSVVPGKGVSRGAAKTAADRVACVRPTDLPQSPMDEIQLGFKPRCWYAP